MNYYYQQNDLDAMFYPSTYFDWPNSFSLKKNHKRIVFALVTLYITYRFSCYLFGLFSSVYRWFIRSSNQCEQQPEMQPQSRIIRFFEATFITLFGLAIGAVAYYAHQQQSTQLLESLILVYSQIVNQIVYHSTGFDLTKSSLNPNENLVVGTFLAGVIIYVSIGMVRFLLYHYIFGGGLSLFGLFLYFYQFPITVSTAQNYSGTMFVIDRHLQTAHLVPTLIPKFLLALTIAYYLFLVLLKSFTLFLKISFRFLLYSVIATILLNSVTSLLNEPNPAAVFESSTTYIPNHRF